MDEGTCKMFKDDRLNRIQKIYLVCGLILLLSSCDPYCGVHYWINNRSDASLYVTYRVQEGSLINKVVIDKHSTMLLQEFEVSGRLHQSNSLLPVNFYDSLGIFIDTVRVTEIKKQYLKEDSWTYSQENTSHFGIMKVGDHVYRLNIANEDLK